MTDHRCEIVRGLTLPPRALLQAWPLATPLLALITADDQPERGRWSIIAECPPNTTGTPTPDTPGDWAVQLPPWSDRPAAIPTDAESDRDLPPFQGGWIGTLAYELGESIEPRVRDAARAATLAGNAHPPASWPDQLWYRINAALVFDHARARWWAVGTINTRRALASRALTLTTPAPTPDSQHHDASAVSTPAVAARFRLSPIDPAALAIARTHYTQGVSRVLSHIAQGDVYQVNLAHPLDFRFTGDPLALFLALCDHALPRMGAFIPLPSDNTRHGEPASTTHRVLVSASPEVFVTIAPGAAPSEPSTISAMPMKGTRGLDLAHPTSAHRELLASPKDRAELTMIVDLMRNDLGRVCDPGTVRVRSLRDIEHHGGPHAPLLQATSTITGALLPDITLDQIIRAVFPPGSVTGAPKVRAMQIIRSLEPHARGPYCGAIGYLSDSGHAAFSVAIRTAHIEGTRVPPLSERGSSLTGTARWWVGAGIVADSDPEVEWQETLTKARAIIELCTE